MKILTNWINKVGKKISGGNTTYSLFFMEKRKEDDVVKKRQVPLN